MESLIELLIGQQLVEVHGSLGELREADRSVLVDVYSRENIVHLFLAQDPSSVLVLLIAFL